MTCDLREFVNREVALRAFAGLRGDPRRRILLVQGPEGIGKSCLLRRLRQDCHQTGTSFAMVDFRSDRGLFAARDVVLRLQEQIDGPFAAHLEKADLEFQTSLAAQAVAGAVFRPLPAAVAGASGDGGNRVTVGDEVQVTGDIFGGNKIVICNSPITILPTNGAGLARDSRTARWNGAFQQALILAAAQGSLVLFFDSYEEALPDVADWLLQQLLRPVLEEMGDLANLGRRCWTPSAFAGRSKSLALRGRCAANRAVYRRRDQTVLGGQAPARPGSLTGDRPNQCRNAGIAGGDGRQLCQRSRRERYVTDQSVSRAQNGPELQPASTGFELFVESWLANAPAELAQAAFTAAVPHQFDRALFATMLDGVEQQELLIQRLQDAGIVAATGGDFYYVPSWFRSPLLRVLVEDQPVVYRVLNSRAAVHIEERANNNSAWWAEVIYHLLGAGEPRASGELLTACELAWQEQMGSLVDRLVAYGREQDAVLDGRARATLRFVAARNNLLHGSFNTAELELRAMSPAIRKRIALCRRVLWQRKGSCFYKRTAGTRLRNASTRRQPFSLHPVMQSALRRVAEIQGDALLQLATRLGGLPGTANLFESRLHGWLRSAQHAPFYLYGSLSRRIRLVTEPLRRHRLSGLDHHIPASSGYRSLPAGANLSERR